MVLLDNELGEVFGPPVFGDVDRRRGSGFRLYLFFFFWGGVGGGLGFRV